MENNTPSDFFVRPETAADYDQIDELAVEAFNGRSDLAPFIRAIRSSPNYIPEYSLVAEMGEKVIGQVMLSKIRLQDGDFQHETLTLSPLWVVPSMQRKGVGAKLVNEVLSIADRNREPLVILEGSPDYYPRFGFLPAAAHNITITLPEWARPEAAMVKVLANDDKNLKGHVVYPSAFDIVSE